MYMTQQHSHYENDRRMAVLTFVLLGVAAVVSVALIIFAVLTA
jgi:hypothetical protein